MASVEPPISKVYKYFFLYIEPLSAFIGAYYAFFEPQTYLDLTHSISSPKQGIPVSTHIILTQLSNLYFLFALNEALVLRATSDLRVWRTVLFCLLLADLGHLYSVSALGWDIYVNFMRWNAINWGNVAFVYAGAAMRLSFLSGFRVGASGQQTTKRSVRRKKPSSKRLR